MISPPQPPILRLLGGAVIESGGVPLGGPAAHRHRIALLALLAVSRRPVSRDKLVAYLWPERETEPARNLLKTAVHELRKLLGENAIRSTGDALSIDPAFLRCDVVEFEGALTVNQLEHAASLYRGPFLDGFFVKESEEFEHWTAAERARLERIHERLVEQLRALPVLPATTIVLPSAVPPLSAPPVRSRRTLIRAATAAALLGIALVIVGARYVSKRSGPPYKPVELAEGEPGSALEFDGRTANASTAVGELATTQVDNITVDMMVKYAGRLTKRQQMLYYNGHGALSGWGIIILNAGDGQHDGTIGVIAGGIVVMATPLVLQRDKWQHLSVERREGKVTVMLDDRIAPVGSFPVNPVRTAKFSKIERTTIGGDGLYDKPTGFFHGAIDRVRIRDLESGYFKERFMFDEGKGSLSVGLRDMVLHVGTAKWVRGPRLPVYDGFWDRLASLCSQAYSGKVTHESPADGEARLRDSSLVMYPYLCTPSEMHVFVQVGTDRSRTMVLRHDDVGLRLDVDSRRSDGSLDSAAHEEGVTIDSGSFSVQHFVADSARKNATSVLGDSWQLEMVPRQTLIYSIRRGTAERVRMEFDLKRQVASPTFAAATRSSVATPSHLKQ